MPPAPSGVMGKKQYIDKNQNFQVHSQKSWSIFDQKHAHFNGKVLEKMQKLGSR